MKVLNGFEKGGAKANIRFAFKYMTMSSRVIKINP